MCCLARMTKNIYCHYSLKSLFFFPQCHYHNFIPRFSSHFKQNKHSIISCKMYLVVILKQFRNLVDMIWMDELIHELCFLCVLRTTDPIRFAHIYRASKGSYCYKHWILINYYVIITKTQWKITYDAIYNWSQYQCTLFVVQVMTDLATIELWHVPL